MNESHTKAMDINPLQADWANAMKNLSGGPGEKRLLQGSKLHTPVRAEAPSRASALGII